MPYMFIKYLGYIKLAWWFQRYCHVPMFHNGMMKGISNDGWHGSVSCFWCCKHAWNESVGRAPLGYPWLSHQEFTALATLDRKFWPWLKLRPFSIPCDAVPPRFFFYSMFNFFFAGNWSKRDFNLISTSFRPKLIHRYFWLLQDIDPRHVDGFPIWQSNMPHAHLVQRFPIGLTIFLMTPEMIITSWEDPDISILFVIYPSASYSHWLKKKRPNLRIQLTMIIHYWAIINPRLKANNPLY